MGRPPRLLGADATYHVTTRGNRGDTIFVDDQDRRKFMALLDDVGAKRGWSGWAHCLMTNHVHLCLRTKEPNLSDGMRDLLGQFSRFVNWKYASAGATFGSRFWSDVIVDDPHLINVIAYIARNPQRAGLVDRAFEYRWSSYAQIVSGDGTAGYLDRAAVLGLFHRVPVHAIAAMRQFVELGGELDRPRSLGALFSVLDEEIAVRSALEEGYSPKAIHGYVTCDYSTLCRRIRRLGHTDRARRPRRCHSGV